MTKETTQVEPAQYILMRQHARNVPRVYAVPFGTDGEDCLKAYKRGFPGSEVVLVATNQVMDCIGKEFRERFLLSNPQFKNGNGNGKKKLQRMGGLAHAVS